MANEMLGYDDVNRCVLQTLTPPGRGYWLGVGGLGAVVAAGIATWTYQIYTGLGVTGLRQPTMWATYITNFVFWVGIAHSGTLISAILFLFRTRWRTPVYRAAETMTVFAVMTAGLFPLIHLGRSWFFYWLLPYPNERWLQPNFRSPLVWDAFAVGTYFTVSWLFLLMGLIPDVAAARDATAGWRRSFYRLLSLGWQGTDEQWRHFSTAYLLLAGLATPLVISVHSVVSWDFAMAQLPGWHSTIFAPYFVAGAIFSGCALVLTLLIPLRRLMGLESVLTPWHFDNLAKVILLMSLVVSYAYGTEAFMAWYSGNPFERTTFHMRYWGPYGPLFWTMVACNCVIPLLLFSPRIRRSLAALFIISICINIGMWLERLVIIAGSLATNFMPSQWAVYKPTWVEITISVASLAWFLMWFSLFAKFLPIVSMTEVKEGVPWLQQALQEQRKAA
ncbi:MAG TPA: NrfD/PsrC family molybdoenzyme membrane anchor subunit [Candidatus Margulisiibacteriota bacterium]|nr:NrfD/PsrC family molybdoenzyme membrane anchor subunit [Candidatus Margulisiibacteriota bacterium]